MDEGLLNDLLECSVCLERLDTSSRVLPCQHTFCLKCLKVIVESHKELRCPECRVLVEAKVEELPPNVLLMRILEGMKNSAPRKVITQRVKTAHAQGQGLTQPSSRADKQVPPHGRALFDYVSKEPGDLSFKKGEIILLQKKLDPFWYHGECSGRSGMFPITYLQVVVPLPSAPALCKALYDFRMSAPDEEGCLAFDKGAVIAVHRRVDENWAEGRLEQRVGIFPIAFVELNQAATHLMHGPVNRPVPPPPDHARAPPSDRRAPAQHPHRYRPTSASAPGEQRSAGLSRAGPRAQAEFVLDMVHAAPALEAADAERARAEPARAAEPDGSESSSSGTTGGCSGSANSSSDASTSDSAEPSLPGSPDAEAPARARPAARPAGPDSLLDFGLGLQAALSPSHGAYAARPRDKRHSLAPAAHLQPAPAPAHNRHSAEILATSLLDHTPEREREKERRRRRSRSDERPLPAAYVALYPYRPQKPDEIELRKGGVYTVRERCRDGWYKGWCERLQRAGVFPGNYVAPLAPVAERAPPDKAPGSSKAPPAPDAPPRAPSPLAAQPSPFARAAQPRPKERAKEKATHSTGVSLMKRLAAMKKCKSPPPAGYSMDNPVFDDSPDASLAYAPQHAVHVRSGSCPSQLLRTLPPGAAAHAGLGQARAKERPPERRTASRGDEGAGQSQHRKSQSLDASAARRERGPQPKERFRCVVPYPPNSEYELELKVDDIVLVCKKRGDGWYKGTLQRTGRTGLFPASFVQSCPPD